MIFLLMLLKKYVRSTNYLNNMCFLHANRHTSILYIGRRKLHILLILLKFHVKNYMFQGQMQV
jgi:hypothetical protein